MTTPYYEHEQWPAFLAAIKAAPDDDLPRLVAADWLDELETDEATQRAELIRVQCELAKGPQCRWAGPGTKACADHNGRLPSCRVETWCEPCHRYRVNYGRAAALAGVVFGGTLGPVALAGGTWAVERGFVARVSAPIAVLHGERCDVMACNGTGRNSELRSVCDNCHGTGRTPGVLAELLKREPVTAAAVEVTDRDPWPNSANGQHLWLLTINPSTEIPDPARLPLELFNLIQPDRPRVTAAFDTPDAARLALGEALVRLHSPKSEVI